MSLKFSAMLLALFSISMTSCSDDDNVATPPNETPFFNLNVGSKWVYHNYTFNSNGEYGTAVIDSVEVIEPVSLNGIAYFKLKHKIGNTLSFEYLKINADGHLVGFKDIDMDPSTVSQTNQGNVMHPGNDLAFEETKTFDYGTIHFYLGAPTNISVEGDSYAVSPYFGDFTPSNPELQSKTVSYHYKNGVGLVKSTEYLSLSMAGRETRLVSFDLQ